MCSGSLLFATFVPLHERPTLHARAHILQLRPLSSLIEINSLFEIEAVGKRFFRIRDDFEFNFLICELGNYR